MIAVMLLGLLFGGAMVALSQGFFMAELSRDAFRVSQLLQNEIERLRTKNWPQLEALVGEKEIKFELFQAQAIAAEKEIESALPQAQAIVARYTLVRDIFPSKEDQMTLIVTVSWKDNRGISHTRKFFTLFTKNGLNDYYYRTI